MTCVEDCGEHFVKIAKKIILKKPPAKTRVKKNARLLGAKKDAGKGADSGKAGAGKDSGKADAGKGADSGKGGAGAKKSPKDQKADREAQQKKMSAPKKSQKDILANIKKAMVTVKVCIPKPRGNNIQIR